MHVFMGLFEKGKNKKMKTFAVLQLSGCAGCEVSLLDADAWLGEYQLAYLPLIMSTHDVPPVDVLLVSGGVRNDEELFKLRRACPCAWRPNGMSMQSGSTWNWSTQWDGW